MDCSLIHDQLIGYHLATLSDVERGSVETHLVECRDCLRVYLAIKAHRDRGGPAGDAPSDAVRLRLRNAVEARFRPTPVSRLRRWFTQPIPLYQGLAVASVVVAAVVAGPVLARVLRPSPVHYANERVDSARPSAESLTIY